MKPLNKIRILNNQFEYVPPYYIPSCITKKQQMLS